MITLAIQGAVGGRAIRPPFFRTKRVALLGSTESIQYAPWTDPRWTLVAHPCAREHCQREPDWYFDLHRPECFRNEIKGWNPRYHRWLKTLQTPIFMQEHWPEIPMAVRYPKERILSEARPYFTNHCAWMIALALTEGVTHLGVFGCQYSHDSERGHQRGSLEYWLGRFEGAGGTVVLPAKFNTVLAYPKQLYGYESHDEAGKLVAAYRPVQKVISGTTSKAEPVLREYQFVDMTTAEGRIPLMKLPDDIPVAWERSGHRVRDVEPEKVA